MPNSSVIIPLVRPRANNRREKQRSRRITPTPRFPAGVVRSRRGRLTSAAQFSPKVEGEKVGRNAGRAVKNKGVTGRTTRIGRGVLAAARAVITSLCDYAAPLLYAATPSRPADFTSRDKITGDGAPPISGPPTTAPGRSCSRCNRDQPSASQRKKETDETCSTQHARLAPCEFCRISRRP